MSKLCDDLRKSILKVAIGGGLSTSQEEWTECKLEEICTEITTGGAAPQGKSNFSDKGPCFVRVVDMGKLGADKVLRDTRDHLSESGIGRLKLFPTGTVLFTKSGASLLLNQRAILEKPMYVVSHIGCAVPKNVVVPDFLYLILKAIDFNEYAHATSLPSLKIADLKNVVVKYPSLGEQKRIVAKVDELMARVADLEKSADALASLKSHYPDEMRASLLQAAMQGKLTEQLPSDGSADELLQQIQAEKEKLIASGKIKKSKSALAPPTDDEIPFPIPENWKWVRLGDMVGVLGGKRIPAGKKLTEKDTGHIYIRVSDMKDGSVMMDNLKFVPDDIYPIIQKYIINKEDVYITVAGTIGRVGKIPSELDGANLTENADRLVFSHLNQDLLIVCLSSPVIQEQVREATKKVGQPKLAIKRIENLVVPLPPLAEQKRIVERLDEAMDNINVVAELIASE